MCVHMYVNRQNIDVWFVLFFSIFRLENRVHGARLRLCVFLG